MGSSYLVVRFDDREGHIDTGDIIFPTCPCGRAYEPGRPWDLCADVCKYRSKDPSKVGELEGFLRLRELWMLGIHLVGSVGLGVEVPAVGEGSSLLMDMLNIYCALREFHCEQVVKDFKGSGVGQSTLPWPKDDLLQE